MRKLLLILMIFLVTSCSDQPKFKDTEGNTIQLAQLNKWVVLTYWAPWCHTCMKEIPELNRFSKNNQNKVIVLGVNYENPAFDALISDIKKANIAFPVLIGDPSQAWQLGDIVAVPMTFIINPKGKIVKQITGPVTYQSLTADLQTLQELK